VHYSGNFYGGHVAQATQAISSAVASLADLLDRQLALMVDEKFSLGLTPNLIAPTSPDSFEAGLHHGFKGAQIAASALTAEALHLTMPMSSFSRSTEAHNQDKVSMGTIAARHSYTVVQLASQVTAIHLLALCQAADLTGTDQLGSTTSAAQAYVRKHVAFLAEDRPMDSEIEAVATLIRSGELRQNVLRQQ
jgi:histidine ammonia-lyase